MATVTPITGHHQPVREGSPTMPIRQYTNYLTKVRRLRPNTIRLRRFYAEKLLDDLPNVEQTTAADLSAWVASRPDWSAETVNAAISTARSFYAWAVMVGMIPASPAAALRPVRVPNKVAPIASDNAVLWAVVRAPNEDAAMILLGAECGLRVHEIAKLHTQDRDGEWLTIIGKGGQTRQVHISPELAIFLDGIESRHGFGYYFRGRNGGHVVIQTVYRHIKKWTGMNPHSLRHRAATTVYREAGNDIRLAQVFLGHASPETTARYVHVEKEDLVRASEGARMLRKFVEAA